MFIITFRRKSHYEGVVRDQFFDFAKVPEGLPEVGAQSSEASQGEEEGGGDAKYWRTNEESTHMGPCLRPERGGVGLRHHSLHRSIIGRRSIPTAFHLVGKALILC